MSRYDKDIVAIRRRLDILIASGQAMVHDAIIIRNELGDINLLASEKKKKEVGAVAIAMARAKSHKRRKIPSNNSLMGQ